MNVSDHRAPHLAAIGPAHGPDVRIAVPLTAELGSLSALAKLMPSGCAAICGTLRPLVPWFSLYCAHPVIGYI